MQEENNLSQTWGLGLESKSYLKRAKSALSTFCQQVQAAGAFGYAGNARSLCRLRRPRFEQTAPEPS